MTESTFKQHRHTPISPNAAYRAAWKRFEAIQKKLRARWKVRKTAVHVLREERRR